MDISEFKQKIYEKVGWDLSGYKSKQLDRRILAFMEKNNFNNLQDFYNNLNKDPIKMKEFLDKITINVSEFFRNPDKFAELKSELLPELHKRSKRLKIWSAGCSSGAEIYSIAIILDELGYLSDSHLVATDIDNNILKKALKGVFKFNEELKNVDSNRLKKYFNQINDNEYEVKEYIKRKVNFKLHNLLNFPYESWCDLILCRNVVIYFSEETKDKVYRGFYNSLKNYGILFIGSTERIIKAKEIGYNIISPFFYQKRKIELNE